MREMTCIVCPLGCRLTVSDDGTADGPMLVTGNRCPRGAVYAEEEIRSPKRVVTATCALDIPKGRGPTRRLPVRGSAPCPKEFVGELLADIYALRVAPPVARGTALIVNWKGRGIDVLAARTVE